MAEEFVVVHNVELGVESTVPASAVKHMGAWREGPLPPPGPKFDPGEKTVSEVNEYLEKCDDDAERGRVLLAERQGKGRAGVLRGQDLDAAEDAARDDVADEAGDGTEQGK
jgi:hypothetical protein